MFLQTMEEAAHANYTFDVQRYADFKSSGLIFHSSGPPGCLVDAIEATEPK